MPTLTGIDREQITFTDLESQIANGKNWSEAEIMKTIKNIINKLNR